MVSQLQQKLCRIVILLFFLVPLAGCGLSTPSAPLGTWKDVAAERYMIIEEVPAPQSKPDQQGSTQASVTMPADRTYTVKLYTFKHRDGDDPTTSIRTDKPIRLERSVPARMVGDELIMEVGATKISVLYHPNGNQILVNGVSEFRRVEEPQA